MSVVRLANNRATRDAFVPPPTLHDDGSPYKWRMFFNQNEEIADADDLASLIDVLIPGYLDKNEDARTLARLQYASEVQRALRVEVLANLTPEEDASLSDMERFYLNWEGASDPDFVDEEGGPVIWSSHLPLVLLDVHYSPFTHQTPPLSSEGDHPVVSNVLWLRAAGELEFLVSLTHAGVITFGAPRAVHRTPASLRN